MSLSKVAKQLLQVHSLTGTRPVVFFDKPNKYSGVSMKIINLATPLTSQRYGFKTSRNVDILLLENVYDPLLDPRSQIFYIQLIQISSRL